MLINIYIITFNIINNNIISFSSLKKYIVFLIKQILIGMFLLDNAHYLITLNRKSRFYYTN